MAVIFNRTERQLDANQILFKRYSSPKMIRLFTFYCMECLLYYCLLQIKTSNLWLQISLMK